MAIKFGTSGNDVVLNGTQDDDILYGLGGDDALSGNGGNDILYGGTGNDLYFVDDAGDQVVEFADQGTDKVSTTVNYVLTANVENLILDFWGGNIKGTGNALDNQLTGNDGHNVLDGKAGADAMQGGEGGDSYYVDNAGDTVTEAPGEGSDTVRASINYTLPAYVENLSLLGSGDLTGTGNALSNKLTGNAGHNLLDGKAGTDTLSGGLGNDSYVVDNAGDKVVENAKQGTDTVQSWIASYSLGANLENLQLMGAQAVTGIGNNFDNTLIGTAFDNSLNGGWGADTMKGGGGGDVYVVDNAGDKVVENAGEGNDFVHSYISYTLPDNVENLFLGASSADLSGVGNALDNQIAGGSGDNLLDGKAGADTLAGGQGDDLYIVDDADDLVVEQADEGTDSVQSWAYSHALSAHIENLQLMGVNAVKGFGNDLDNVLGGNTNDNTLAGGAGNDTIQGGDGDDTLGGGSGEDSMEGGSGDDSYGVDSLGDSVLENPGAGTDTVQAWVNYTLGTDLENLSLQGGDDLNGTGNAADNILAGNAGHNVLDGGDGVDVASYVNAAAGVSVSLALSGPQDTGAGLDTLLNIEGLRGSEFDDALTGDAGDNALTGGSGADILSGGAGADQFRFNLDWGWDKIDTVADFAPGQDSIRLFSEIPEQEHGLEFPYNGLQLGAKGQFAADDERFHIGANAHDASDRVIYNPGLGALYFDADGDGSGAAFQIAILAGQPGLTATDIWSV